MRPATRSVFVLLSVIPEHRERAHPGAADFDVGPAFVFFRGLNGTQ